MGRFEKIDDASRHIDDQLILGGFLSSSQSLELSGAANTKLIINTVHRLLTSLDDKNKQLQAAHDKIEELKRAPKLVEIKSDPQPRLTRCLPPVKVKKSTSNKDDARVKKVFQVKLNRLQSIIDELKWQLNLERNRNRNSLGPDITWTVHESLERKEEQPASPLETVELYRDEITRLKIELQRLLYDKKMIVLHLHLVNRYTYSTGVLDVRPASNIIEEEEWRKWMEQLDKDDLQLKELVQDWYEIINIANKVRE